MNWFIWMWILTGIWVGGMLCLCGICWLLAKFMDWLEKKHPKAWGKVFCHISDEETMEIFMRKD